MSYLGSQSYSGVLIPNQIFKGQIYKIPSGYLSLIVSIKLNEEGYLTIYSSNDGVEFSPFDQTLIQAPFKSIIYPLRGQYFYLNYENFVVEDNIQLLCRISEALPAGLIQDLSVNVENQPPFLFDASGNLKVSSSGGGTTSDVNVLNFPSVQNVNVSNQIEGYALNSELAKFTDIVTFNSNQAMWTAIDYMPDISGNVTITNPMENYALESSLLKVVNNKGDVEGDIYFSSGAPVWSDTLPLPTQNTKSDIGWNYVNTGGSGKSMNFYYYDGTNETDKTLGDVEGQYCVVTNNSTKYINRMILTTYTVGSLNVWYQSRVTHSNYNSKMAPGMQYLLYWGEVDSDIYPNLPRINLSNITTNGPALPIENILTLSLASDSAQASGDINVTIDSLGVVFTGGISRTYKLLNNNNMYTLTTSIKDNLDKLTFSSNKLLCDVSGQSLSISNFPSTQPISGSVSVSNFPSVQVVDVSGNVDISGNVNVANFPSSQIVSGSVSVSNQISGYATELTLGSIDMTLSGGNLVTQSKVENKFGDNLRVDLYADSGSAQEKLTSTNGQLKVYNVDAKISELKSLQTTANTYLYDIKTDLDKNNYDASGNLKTNIQNTSLDTHCFGSSDGSTWHHLKTNPNGVLSTNAILETDANGALTSTVSSGSYNALDVSIKNSSLSVSVSNSSLNVASTSSGTWGNSLNNGTINGNSQSTGFNISSYAYIYAIYRDSNTSNYDSLRIEYSFDNSNWYYLGDSIYPSIPQGENTYRQGIIYDKRKYSWNYIRINNTNNYSLNNVYFTVLGSSI